MKGSGGVGVGVGVGGDWATSRRVHPFGEVAVH